MENDNHLTTKRTVEGEVVTTVDIEADDSLERALLRVEGEGAGFTVDSSSKEGTYMLVRQVDE